MGNKMTPEGQRLNVAAMYWWRHWRANLQHPMSPEMLAYYNDPATRVLVEACADLDALQRHNFAVRNTAASFALERGPQGEQLDRDTGAGGVEQQ